MRKLRFEYEENGINSKDSKFPEFPIDISGPYIISYTREGRLRKRQFDNFEDSDIKLLVRDCIETGTEFEVLGLWPGQMRSDFFILNQTWVAGKLGLVVAKKA